MTNLLLSKPDRSLRADIKLDGSKSISNRALIALALAGANPTDWLSGLSTSKDTATLLRLLTQPTGTYDAGDAGTTFRFLTAYLACRPGTQVLTGSARMRERPIGPLVLALRELGADIQFLEKEGYPPLQIGEMRAAEGGGRATVRVPADTSSQFLSALLLVGPYLPGGLELVPEGHLVSRPYLEMTLRLMRHFGAAAAWQGERIAVEPGGYTPRPLRVEADWSAASYWYAMAAFSDDLDLHLGGLFAESWQGDAVLADMMQSFGIQTSFEGTGLSAKASAEAGIRLSKNGRRTKPLFEQDFLECPDIAQTLAVVCAGLGVQGLFSGLETLSIKETDRIAALKTELAKVGVSFVKLPPHFSKKTPGKVFYSLEGLPAVALAKEAPPPVPPRFATYGDHRMAMSFAPLAFFQPIEIEQPGVVEKSYPGFWEDLRRAGFVASP